MNKNNHLGIAGLNIWSLCRAKTEIEHNKLKDFTHFLPALGTALVLSGKRVKMTDQVSKRKISD